MIETIITTAINSVIKFVSEKVWDQAIKKNWGAKTEKASDNQNLKHQVNQFPQTSASNEDDIFTINRLLPNPYQRVMDEYQISEGWARVLVKFIVDYRRSYSGMVKVKSVEIIGSTFLEPRILLKIKVPTSFRKYILEVSKDSKQIGATIKTFW